MHVQTNLVDVQVPSNPPWPVYSSNDENQTGSLHQIPNLLDNTRVRAFGALPGLMKVGRFILDDFQSLGSGHATSNPTHLNLTFVCRVCCQSRKRKQLLCCKLI